MKKYLWFLFICVIYTTSCINNSKGNPIKSTNVALLSYWDDKIDSIIVKQDRELLEKSFKEFISMFNYASDDTIQLSIHQLMKNAEKDPTFYMQMTIMAEMNLFEKHSPLMKEKYYIYFLQEIKATECLHKGYKFRFEKQLEICLRNQPGTKANNIVFIESNGNTNTLYDLDAKHILLVFYSPGCHQCMEVINEMKQNEQLNQWITSNELKVLAMYTDGDKKEWVTQKDYFPLTWINGNDFDEDIYKKGTYILRMNPSIYLLDSDKKVLLKDTNMEDISKYFLSLHN